MRLLAGLAQFDDAGDQWFGARFDGLDPRQRFALVWPDIAQISKELVERKRRFGVETGELFDFVVGALNSGAVFVLHDIAQADGAIMHAAAKIDCIALFDGIHIRNCSQILVDLTHLSNADCRDDDYEGDDNPEAEAQPLSNRKFHCL